LGLIAVWAHHGEFLSKIGVDPLAVTDFHLLKIIEYCTIKANFVEIRKIFCRCCPEDFVSVSAKTAAGAKKSYLSKICFRFSIRSACSVGDGR